METINTFSKWMEPPGNFFKKNFYPWQNVHGVCFLITQHTFNKVAGQFSK